MLIFVSCLPWEWAGIQCSSRVYCATDEVKYIAMNKIENAYLNATVIKENTVQSIPSCQQFCIQNKCQSINLNITNSNELKCQLLALNKHSNSSLIVNSQNMTHFYVPVRKFHSIYDVNYDCYDILAKNKLNRTINKAMQYNKKGQDRTGQDRTGQDRTGQDRTGQDRTGQDRTGQDRTGQDRTGQDRTGQDRTGQDRTGQDRTGQGRTGQDRTGQDRTKQNRTEQNRTGQDRTGQNRARQNRTQQNATLMMFVVLII